MKIRNLVFCFLLVVCTGAAPDLAKGGQRAPISPEEVMRAQASWGKAIVSIGAAYTDQRDYRSLAVQAVENIYGYDEGLVLFKPTKASKVPFRLTTDQAVSYFVTGIVPEDHGFAVQPWSNVRFENAGIITDGDSALAMGNYYFTDAADGRETRVEYTFGYFRDNSGRVRINLHHSSLPYVPHD